MKLLNLGLALALGALFAVPARAALVISEVLANEVGSDVTGEWIELYNTGPAAIDLSSYKIGDEEASTGAGATEAMHLFPAGASIAPGAVQIVAVSAARFSTVYGFLPTYEATDTDPTVPNLTIYSTWDSDGGALNMGNGNDQALLLDGSDAVVDTVNWGNNIGLNPGIDVTTAPQDGQSFERKNVFIDTNTAADWQFGPAGATAAARSTPGVVNVPEPAARALTACCAALAVAGRRRRR